MSSDWDPWEIKAKEAKPQHQSLTSQSPPSTNEGAEQTPRIDVEQLPLEHSPTYTAFATIRNGQIFAKMSAFVVGSHVLL
jgi:hypothetical protein